MLPVPTTAIIVVAAGAGTRLEASIPKAFVGVGARTILHQALVNVFSAAFAQVVVVAPPTHVGEAETELQAVAGERISVSRVVAGGATRQQSVAAGLKALWGDIRTVLVHDAARAFTPAAAIDRVAEAVTPAVGVVPVLPVTDTIKRVSATDVVEAVDRSDLAAAQTPQGFPRDLLQEAYQAATEEYTDDAALFAAAGYTVKTVTGSPLAFKITTPGDLDRARQLLAVVRPAQTPTFRVGVGTDAHAFAPNGTLRLAGLEWPDEVALSGHSDGDAIAHAIVDALLGAAGLGDIGTQFGSSRPEYAGASGVTFLESTAALLRDTGWRIGNVSVQFQGNRPKFSSRRREAEDRLSTALGGAPVSVSATTTDGLGFAGEGAGIQAIAVATVVGRDGV